MLRLLKGQWNTPEGVMSAIEARKNYVASLKESLPYADGPAYSQDKQRIREAQNEIFTLEQRLEELCE